MNNWINQSNQFDFINFINLMKKIFSKILLKIIDKWFDNCSNESLVKVQKLFVNSIANCEGDTDVDEDKDDEDGEDKCPVVATDAVAGIRSAITCRTKVIVGGISPQNKHRKLSKIWYYVITCVFIKLNLGSPIFKMDFCNVSYNTVLRFNR